LLADPDVEAVYITLPNSMHKEWTLKAAAAKKHVLCEKPLAVNAAEAEEMAAGCAREGVKLMEAFMYRCHPQTHRILENIRAGSIGEVRYIRSNFCFNISDLKNVRLRSELAGGVLMDVGCYCLNLSRYLADEEPEEVSATAHFGIESGVDEDFVATLRFPREIVAQFHVSFRTTSCAEAEVVGSYGKIRIPSPWKPDDKRSVYEVIDKNETCPVVVENGGNIYRLEFKGFGRALRGEGDLPLEPEDAIANMKAIDALYASARSGKPVKL